MTKLNALAFLALGTVMSALPHLAPALVQHSQVGYAFSNSTMWLMAMSWVTRGIGLSYLLKYASAELLAWAHAWSAQRSAARAAFAENTLAQNRHAARVRY